MDLGLEGRVALVTGSTRGIGRAIATRLAAEGARVVVNGRDPELVAQVVAALPGDAWGIAADVTTVAGCAAIAEALAEREGRLGVLVCNVGSGASVPPGQETSDEWRRMLDLNLMSAAHMVQATRPLLATAGGAALCISSICGVAALGCPVAYAAAKAALNAYVRNMARPLAADGIRLNALAPGNILFDGGTWAKKRAADPVGVQAMLDREVALQRFGTPEEIADFAAFLVSPRAAFATGSIHVLDGGQLRA